MNTCSTLLFDLDGTLLDSREGVIDAVYYTIEEHCPGLFTRGEITDRFGEALEEFLHVVEARINEQQVQRLELPDQFKVRHWDRTAYCKDYFTYMERHNRQVQLFPFVREGIEALKKRGFQLAVVTNKQRKLALQNLEMAAILHLMDTVVTLDDVVLGKPSPEPIQKAMAILGTVSEETLMIGDSRYDLLSARAAGVRSVLLEWYGADQRIQEKPHYRFKTFQMLVDELLLASVQGKGE
ncbi:HAD-IA family hydrolase [Brevibacillus laterosporus]|uniref:HAD-IA family hydrolase n=1 Tax=Brevibacillus halotolerans TaxID=1507437 RepID=A0ABT4HSX9_9BACL|nr:MULTISPECIES: HAD-IA family hydrolase [Brevibacillus]MCR8984181.1 HAD-IA family hydrolase [Brevibacillus laterosporus]MCZ0829900.1 HAD-IA family hydrolase [Brevibacillus halotolerans]